MYGVNINKSWSYKELLENIEVIKSQIWDVIASFSCFEQKKKTEFMRYVRRSIYSLNFKESRKDKILEYIYNDIELSVLKKV